MSQDFAIVREGGVTALDHLRVLFLAALPSPTHFRDRYPSGHLRENLCVTQVLNQPRASPSGSDAIAIIAILSAFPEGTKEVLFHFDQTNTECRQEDTRESDK